MPESGSRTSLAGHIVDDYLLPHLSPAQQEQLLGRRACERELARLQAEVRSELETALGAAPSQPQSAAQIDALAKAAGARLAAGEDELAKNHPRDILNRYIKTQSGR